MREEFNVDAKTDRRACETIKGGNGSPSFGEFWFCPAKQDCGAFSAFPRYKQHGAIGHGQWKDRRLEDQACLEAARAAAAQYLRAQGYIREADMAAGGEGDDFQEVRMAVAIWQIMNPAPVSAPPVKRHGRRIAGEEC